MGGAVTLGDSTQANWRPGARPHGPLIPIGVIGPDDLVAKVMAAAGAEASWHLVGAPYRAEQEAVRRLRRLRARVEAVLFTGPVPYDLCAQAGALDLPALFVPLSGAALYSTLLRAALDGRWDITRLSIDTLRRVEVEQAYREVGLPTGGLHVREYEGPEPADTLAVFHESLWRSGAVSAAATCIRSVHERLQRRGVPSLRILPTAASIRNALQTLSVMTSRARYEQAQLAIALIDVDGFERLARAAPSEYWIQELKLSLHQTLLREARTLGGTVLPLGSDEFLVITTRGALQEATREFTVAPFLDEVHRSLGVRLNIGIGLGHSAQEAETNAHNALARARAAGGDRCFLVGETGVAVGLESAAGASGAPGATDTRAPAPNSLALYAPHAHRPAGRPGTRSIPPAVPPDVYAAMVRARRRTPPALLRLARALQQEPVAAEAAPVPYGAARAAGADATPSAQVVALDTARTARLLGVTPRSARRVLLSLARQGLAWPVAPESTGQAGRPRQRYWVVIPEPEVTSPPDPPVRMQEV